MKHKYLVDVNAIGSYQFGMSLNEYIEMSEVVKMRVN